MDNQKQEHQGSTDAEHHASAQKIINEFRQQIDSAYSLGAYARSIGKDHTDDPFIEVTGCGLLSEAWVDGWLDIDIG